MVLLSRAGGQYTEVVTKTGLLYFISTVIILNVFITESVNVII